MSHVTAPRTVPQRRVIAARPATGRARVDALVRSVAVSGLWLGLLLVGYWWATGGGVRDLAGAETTLNSTGRLTGLLSADLLLVQVLLMSRLPLLERAFGQDRLARQHRIVGFTSFNLMLAHIVLVTLGYAATDNAGPVREFVSLTLDYPGMLLALAGTIALILVVTTSLKAARRKLRYESWHLLHLYAYLGVGLALPHQLWTGTDFSASPLATAYWWTVWAVAAGCMLVFRFGLPLWRSARHRLVVDAVVPEAPGVVSVYLRGHRLDRLGVRAGQFFGWRFLRGPGWTRAHPYSLSAAPRRDL